jgi:hypothetical protein
VTIPFLVVSVSVQDGVTLGPKMALAVVAGVDVGQFVTVNRTIVPSVTGLLLESDTRTDRGVNVLLIWADSLLPPVIRDADPA